MNKVYRSKVDAWLGILLGGMPIVMLYVIGRLIENPVTGHIIVAILLLPAIALPVSLLLATRYKIAGAFLFIQCGFMKWKIPIKDISKVEFTNDPVSSPALSLDRIRITYGSSKSVLVSPVNKEDFLQGLYDLGVPYAGEADQYN